MKTIIYAVHIAELLAAILASIYYFKYKKTPIKFFYIYLWYVLINEALASILIPKGIVSYHLTNIYGLITSLYVTWICLRYVRTLYLNRIIKFLMLIIGITHIAEFVIKGFDEPWAISKTIGPLLGVVALFIYLINLFKSASVINPFKETVTYFLIGFALFFVASPVILMARIYYLNNLTMSYNLSYIMAAIAILMYTIFSFGFIYSKKASGLEEN
ncbi:hypothetical protein [Dokdonia sp. Asnod1-B02]|uniref:hypothetical protein n=1 Tax=Dokdonia sp. Asnod1-B02 TaxID=3160573 RepID=UPI00386D8D40